MPSPPKSVALAIAPKFTALLSICGSTGIVVKVLSNERRRKKTMHRLVMGMSICDILASIWYFTSTWAIPAGTLSWFGDGEEETIFWAGGDQDGVSCSFAGYFNQFAVATPLYNSTLAVFYLLVVKYGWRDNKIEKIEWILHTIPVGYAFVTSTFAVAAKLYGMVEWTCWILPFNPTIPGDDEDLTPIQSKFRYFQWIFLFGPVWVCIIFISVIFVILYRKMKSLEQIMDRYPYNSAFSSSIKVARVSGGSEGFSGHEKSECSPSDEGQEKENQITACENKSDIEEGDSSNKADTSQDLSDSKKEENDENSNSVKEDADLQEKHAEPTNNTGTSPIESSPQAPEDNKGDTRESWTASISKGFTARDSTTKSNRPCGREATKSKKIAVQGLLYVGAFYITWLFPTISRITDLIGTSYFAIQFLDTFLIPLQGFFNFCIYIRPRFILYRKHNADVGLFKAILTVVTEIKIDE